MFPLLSAFLRPILTVTSIWNAEGIGDINVTQKFHPTVVAEWGMSPSAENIKIKVPKYSSSRPKTEVLQRLARLYLFYNPFKIFESQFKLPDGMLEGLP